MQFNDIITSQYFAALEMLRRAIVACPDELWDEPDQANRFWHVAYHALFYTHLYVQPSEADFMPWTRHRPNLNFMGTLPWPPHDAVEPGAPYTREELLDYLAVVRAEVRKQTANLDLSRDDSGFYWLPMGKLELQIYTIRHVQQHAGELCQRLQDHDGTEIDWVGIDHEALNR